MSRQKYADPTKIASIRKIIEEYDSCQDEADMKRKYLHLRLKHASITKKRLSEVERRAILEKEKTRLLHEISETSKEIEAFLQARHGKMTGAIIRAHLNRRINYALEKIAHLRRQYGDLNKQDPLITSKPGIERSSSMVANVALALKKKKDWCGQLPADLQQYASRDLLKEIHFQLCDLLTQCQLAEPTIDIDQIAALPNLQKVAIEMSKVLLLLKLDRRKEALDRLDGLQVPFDASSDNFIETIEKISFKSGLASQLSEASNRLSNVTLSVQRSNLLVNSKVQHLHELLQAALTKLATMHNDSVERPAPNVGEKDNLLNVVADHCMSVTALTDTSSIVNLSTNNDIRLSEMMSLTGDKIYGIHQSAQELYALFDKECTSAERLQSKEYIDLINSLAKNKAKV